MKDNYSLAMSMDDDASDPSGDGYVEMRRMRHQRRKSMVRAAAEAALPVDDASFDEIAVPKRNSAPVREQRAEPVERLALPLQDFAVAAENPLATPWDALPEVRTNGRRHMLARAPLVSYFRDGAASKSFDLLRTRLLQTLKANGWSRIAIAAPTAGCGATFTAVNLALSLSRVPGSRTILMDLNQRDPGVADLLDVENPGNMAEFLSGRVPMSQHMVRASKTLALGLNSAPCQNASELLHNPTTAERLDHMTAALQPDVVVYDMPPVLAFDDVAAFLPQVDGVLLVSDGTKTTAKHIAECERILEGQTQLLGVILNRARRSSVPTYDG
jgi:Mrp family chromosome partitioning ATPase